MVGQQKRRLCRPINVLIDLSGDVETPRLTA